MQNLFDKDIEEIIIGTILLDLGDNRTKDVLSKLSEEDFFIEENKLIYKSIKELEKTNAKIDIITTTHKLRELNNLEKVGGAYNVSRYTNRVVSSANLEEHTEILLRLSIKRKLLELSQHIQKNSLDTGIDVEGVFSFIEKGLHNIANKLSLEKETSLEEIILDTNNHIQNASKQKGITGTTTGIFSLDRAYGGRQGGKFYIIAARPAMGKSVRAMNEFISAGLKKEPVAMFNLEMGNKETMIRILSHLSGIDGNKINKGNLDSYEWNKIYDAQSKILDCPIYMFDDIHKINIIANKIRKLVNEKGVRTVYIDYLQLIAPDTTKGSNREQEVSNISRTLKKLTQELKIAIVALSQLSRSVEQRGGDKIPMLSDLRESGSIEQDSDAVEFIYRPEYYGITEDSDGYSTEGVAYSLIKKNRGGGLFDVKLKFKKETTSMIDYNEGFSSNYNFENKDLTVNYGFIDSKENSENNDEF